MELLRTPDEQFENLPGYSFAPHYVTVPHDGTEGIRIHYLDEGPADASETLLLLHGEPSWSFLYRKMVPPLVAKGHRVIATDLVGFGRSDKPANRDDYTYARHVEWLRAALLDDAGLGLSGITLVCQDWGGLLGLRLVAEHSERFRRVVVANTGMPTGDTPMGDAFMAWQNFSQTAPELPVGAIIDMGTVTTLAPEVVAAYNAPYPDETFKEGARQFPLLVPTRPDDPASDANRKAWESLHRFERPVLCAFSDGDPITAGGSKVFLDTVPGTKGVTHTTIVGGGHFLQEDKGEDLAAAVAEFIEATPS